MIKVLFLKSRGVVVAVGNAYRDAFSGLPREIWYLALAMLINRSGSMVLPFLSIYLHESMGYSEDAAILMVSIFGIGSLLGSFFGGYAAERFGPIRVQIIALVVNAIGFALLSVMPNYFTFAAVLLPTSILAEAFRPANLASITLFCPPELHRRAFGLNRLAINLGVGIAPPIGGFLSYFSYHWLFWTDAATCFAAAVAMFVLLSGSHAELLQRITPHATQTRQNPFRDKAFMAFVFLAIVCFSVFFQFFSTYPLFLADEYGLDNLQIGVLLTLNPIIVVACEMIVVNRLHAWRHLPTIAWGSFLMCAGFGVLPFGYGFWFAAFGVLILTVGEMLMMPQAMVHVSARSDEQSRGRYIGIYTTGISLAFVLGPVLGSLCYRVHHSLFAYVSLVAGLFVLIGFYLVEGMESAERKFERDAPTNEKPLLASADLESVESKS